MLRETGPGPSPHAGPVPAPHPRSATGQGTSPVPAEATAAQSGSALGSPTTASLRSAQQMPAQAGRLGDGDRAWSKSGGTPYRIPHTSAAQEPAAAPSGTASDPARVRWQYTEALSPRAKVIPKQPPLPEGAGASHKAPSPPRPLAAKPPPPGVAAASGRTRLVGQAAVATPQPLLVLSPNQQSRVVLSPGPGASSSGPSGAASTSSAHAKPPPPGLMLGRSAFAHALPHAPMPSRPPPLPHATADQPAISAVDRLTKLVHMGTLEVRAGRDPYLACTTARSFNSTGLTLRTPSSLLPCNARWRRSKSPRRL